MLVKQKYSHLSLQLMYEWSLEEPTAFNRAKRQHYAFFSSVMNLEVSQLTMTEIIRLSKIEDQHMRDCRRPTYRRR